MDRQLRDHPDGLGRVHAAPGPRRADAARRGRRRRQPATPPGPDRQPPGAVRAARPAHGHLAAAGPSRIAGPTAAATTKTTTDNRGASTWTTRPRSRT